MRSKILLVGVGVLIGALLSAAAVFGGGLNPGVGPAAVGSQMFTLQQIYDRLNSGAAGSKMTAFTEPSSGPATGTMHTLDEVMAKAPAADATNGATADQVFSGKTFWGLGTGGEWGPQTGSFSFVGIRATLSSTPNTSKTLDGSNSDGTNNGADTESADVTQILGVANADTLPQMLGVPSSYRYSTDGLTVYSANVAYPASISTLLGTPSYDPFTGLPLTAINSYPPTWIVSSSGVYKFSQNAPIALRVRSVMSELSAYRQKNP